MIYLSGIVGFLLVLTAEARVGNSSELDFCTETKECLLFDLVCETSDYQVRHYDAVKWVSTTESSICMEFASMATFRRLYDYITGNNVDGQKMDMTAPVLVKVNENNYFWKTYTMSFLLPAEHQANPPQPTDKRVYIDKKPDMKMYVKSYTGWMLTHNDKSQANSLATALDMVKADYESDFHYAVGYNSPMTMFNRHNEVWYVVDDNPVCPGEVNSSEES